MEPGNGQPWVFGRQSCVCGPRLHLSGAGVARDMRAQRVCQARQPLSTDPEVQGKLGCLWVWDQLEPSVLRAGLSWHRSRTLSPLAGDHIPLLALGTSSSIIHCHLRWGHLSALSPQHDPLLCGQGGEYSPVSCPGSPLLSFSAPSCPLRKGKWVLGTHPLGGLPKAGVQPGIKLCQVSGTHSTSPMPSCSCRPFPSHGEGRTMASQPGSSGRESVLGETGMEVQGVQHGLAWLGQWGLGTAFYSDQTR